MKQKRTFTRKEIPFLLSLLPFTLLALDARLKVVNYSIRTPKVQKSHRICLLTDLHGCYYGKNQKTLVNAIKKGNPDVILLGGDIFDDVHPYKNSEILLSEIAPHYPCYYVTGNHEYWSEEVSVILDTISSYAVTILDGTHDLLEIDGDTLQICGVSDPDGLFFLEEQDSIITQLRRLESERIREHYSILLTHRPELIKNYLKYSYDLVLAGHAHGGQWRIPALLNGVFAPNQGLFPEYAGGFYSFPHMNFIVSRGLARETTIIPRMFNRPEVVFIDISN